MAIKVLGSNPESKAHRHGSNLDEETCRVEEDVEVGDEEDDALVLVADVDDDVAVGVGVAADAVVSVADAAW